MESESSYSPSESPNKSESLPKLADFNYETFKKFLSFTSEHPIHTKELPNSIETGKIGDALNSMYQDTDSDPKRRERGNIVVQSVDRKTLIHSKPLTGETNHVNISQLFEKRPPGSVSLVLHTHPSESISSATDLSFLVAVERSHYSIDGLMTAVGGLNVLFLRTAETKTINESLSEEWVKEANKDMQEHYDSINLGFTLFNRKKLYNARAYLENNKVVGEICKKHNIAVYTSKPGETRFVKAELI